MIWNEVSERRLDSSTHSIQRWVDRAGIAYWRAYRLDQPKLDVEIGQYQTEVQAKTACIDDLAINRRA